MAAASSQATACYTRFRDNKTVLFVQKGNLWWPISIEKINEDSVRELGQVNNFKNGTGIDAFIVCVG